MRACENRPPEPQYQKQTQGKSRSGEGRDTASQGLAASTAKEPASRYCAMSTYIMLSAHPVVKCKENRPACDYCAHRGLQCEWPEIQINQVEVIIRNPMQGLAIPAAPQSNLPVFTMQDFRFFQHFIDSAYPHHPIDNDWQWTHDVPSMACDVSKPFGKFTKH
jgi:hypothetical protein